MALSHAKLASPSSYFYPPRTIAYVHSPHLPPNLHGLDSVHVSSTYCSGPVAAQVTRLVPTCPLPAPYISSHSQVSHQTPHDQTDPLPRAYEPTCTAPATTCMAVSYSSCTSLLARTSPATAYTSPPTRVRIEPYCTLDCTPAVAPYRQPTSATPTCMPRASPKYQSQAIVCHSNWGLCLLLQPSHV